MCRRHIFTQHTCEKTDVNEGNTIQRQRAHPSYRRACKRAMAFSANKVLGMSPVHTVLVHVYTTDTYSFTVKGNLVASKNDIHIRTGPEMLLLETHSRNPHTWPQRHTRHNVPPRAAMERGGTTALMPVSTGPATQMWTCPIAQHCAAVENCSV